jgi:hypothetical protein
LLKEARSPLGRTCRTTGFGFNGKSADQACCGISIALEVIVNATVNKSSEVRVIGAALKMICSGQWLEPPASWLTQG